MTRPSAAVTAGLALAFAAMGGCGSDARPAALSWQSPPRAYRVGDLPNDRVVLARVRNVSSGSVHLEASRVVVRDARGRVLRSSARYIGSFAHGLYGAFQKPSYLPAQELSRLGLVIDLPAGRSAPITLAWRVAAGAAPARTVDYGRGSLVLPRSAAPAAP